MKNYPTERQKQTIWTAVTALSWTALGAVVVLAVWLLARLLGLLYPVLLPLGFAAILAYILDPVVEFLESRHFSRNGAILLVLGVIAILLTVFLVLVVPPLLAQLFQLASELPATLQKIQGSIDSYLIRHPNLQSWVDQNWPKVEAKLPEKFALGLAAAWSPIAHVFGWLSAGLGFLFVPLYVYYFLLEKEKIAARWIDYVPMQESPWREEVVLVLTEINRYLIVFFRGQVVVGMCIGLMTFLGLLIIGLPYALLIGVVAGTLSLIPYLGVISSLVPALILAAMQGTGWELPVLVLVVFGVVQMAEGLILSPWIMGDRTGLHPLSVIIGILVWSLILPGLLGPILAVPLTATLRVLMYRYVWLRALEPSSAKDS
jgi:predicted PurR-regulated permease PerM